MDLRQEVYMFSGMPIKVLNTGDTFLGTMDFIHQHDCHEINWCRSGKVVYRLVDEVLEGEEGDILVLGANVAHQLIVGPGTPVRLPGLFFMDSAFINQKGTTASPDALKAYKANGISLAYKVPANAPAAGQLRRCISEIIDEMAANMVECDAIVIALLLQISALLRRHLSVDPKSIATNIKANTLTYAIDYIEKHFADDINLAEVAGIVGLCPTYFSARFHKLYNMSFVEYLTAVRLRKAIYLLRETDMKVTDIAIESGFQSMANFYYHFKQFTGISPKQFRIAPDTCGNCVYLFKK